MKTNAAAIWDIWNAGGPFIGDNRPHAIVTVEEDWYLDTYAGYPGFTKGPIRSWYHPDRVETPVPGVETITIDRTVDADAATVEITIFNQKMWAVGTPSAELGQPGYYTWNRGNSVDATARWGHAANEWSGKLIPNACLRCVDTETEILTQRGWLRWDELEVGDRTLGINPETGLSEWQVVREVFRRPVSTRMVHLRTRVHDSLTTGDHRWLVTTRDTAGFQWRTTDTLTTNSQIPLGAAPGARGVPGLYEDDFVELAAWYFTEGSAEHRQRSMTWGGNITQSQRANPQNVERIRGVLTRLYGTPGPLPRGPLVPQETVDEVIRLYATGLNKAAIARKLSVSHSSVKAWVTGRGTKKSHRWRESPERPADPDGTQVFRFTAEVTAELRAVIVGPDKVPSTEFLCSLTQSQLELFIDVALLGDGSLDQRSWQFIQAHLGRTEAFEMACALAGRPTHTHTGRDGIWRVRMLTRNRTKPVGAARQTEQRGGPGASREEVAYTGVVWCPNVVHGNWLARRNGTVFYTGNTYQGYASPDTTLEEALAAGSLIMTGVWLLDDILVTTNGRLKLVGRDLAKLLIEEKLYPPVVPGALYPEVLRFCRYINLAAVAPKGGGTVAASSEDPGHPKEHSFEHNPDTYWASAPNPYGAAGVEWIEFVNNGDVDRVVLDAWGGGYMAYVSLFVDGAWVGTNSAPDYPNLTTGGPPFVAQSGVPFDSNIAIDLGGTYNPSKIRLTFTNLYAPTGYRAGVREWESEATVPGAGPEVDGNYLDGVDIVKLLLLWAGFFDLEGGVLGFVESTGWYAKDCILEDQFDKKPVIDGIKVISQIVAYLMRIGPTGLVHFESPNYWEAGNFDDDTGDHTADIAEIDEALQLTDYTVKFSDAPVRDEIIISTDDPALDVFDTTVTTRFRPFNSGLLRGIPRPFMWFNEVFTDPADQRALANLVAIFIWFAQRQGQVTMQANPAIGVDDQVRIWERQASESYVHYVRGSRLEQNLVTGDFKQTLTTHWLGDWPHLWAVDSMVSPDLGAFLGRSESPSTRRFGATVETFTPRGDL